MEINKTISLDISKQGVQNTIYLTEHDVGATKIEFSLNNQGRPVTIKKGENTATLYIDGIDVLEDVTISDDNRIIYTVQSSATSKAGEFKAVLQIVSEDNKSYYSPQFQISVAEDITKFSQVLDSSPFAAVIKARNAAESYLEEFEEKIHSDATAEALDELQGKIDATRLTLNEHQNDIADLVSRLAPLEPSELPDRGEILVSAKIVNGQFNENDPITTGYLEAVTSDGNKIKTEVIDTTARENNNKNYSQILERVVKVEEKDGKLNLFYVNPKYGEPDEPQYLERESSEVVDKHIRTYAITTLFVDKELGKLKYADGKEEFEQEIVDKKARGAVKNIDIGNNPQSFNYGKLYYSSVDGTQGEGYQEIVDATARQNVGDLQTSVGKIDKVLNGSGVADTGGLVGRTGILESQILALSSATRFKGVKESLPSSGSTGDIIIVGNKEFIYDSTTNTGVDGTKWVELGDTTALSQSVSTLNDAVYGVAGSGLIDRVGYLENNGTVDQEARNDIETLNTVVYGSGGGATDGLIGKTDSAILKVVTITNPNNADYGYISLQQCNGIWKNRQEIIDKTARNTLIDHSTRINNLELNGGTGGGSAVTRVIQLYDYDNNPYPNLQGFINGKLLTVVGKIWLTSSDEYGFSILFPNDVIPSYSLNGFSVFANWYTDNAGVIYGLSGGLSGTFDMAVSPRIYFNPIWGENDMPGVAGKVAVLNFTIPLE